MSAFFNEYRFFIEGCAIGIIGLIIRKIWITAASFRVRGRGREVPEHTHTHGQLKYELGDSVLMHPIDTFYTLDGGERHNIQTVSADVSVKLILTFMESGKKFYFNPIDRISIGGKEDECDIVLEGLPEETIAEIYFNVKDNMFYIRRVSSVQTEILLNARPLLAEMKIKNRSVIRLGNYNIQALMRTTE